jgi:hypothetical protein
MMQAETDYGVRVIKPFAQFNTGFIMYPTAIYRDALLKRGWVEEVKRPPSDDNSAKATNRNKPTLKLR